MRPGLPFSASSLTRGSGPAEISVKSDASIHPLNPAPTAAVSPLTCYSLSVNGSAHPAALGSIAISMPRSTSCFYLGEGCPPKLRPRRMVNPCSFLQAHSLKRELPLLWLLIFIHQPFNTNSLSKSHASNCIITPYLRLFCRLWCFLTPAHQACGGVPSPAVMKSNLTDTITE